MPTSTLAQNPPITLPVVEWSRPVRAVARRRSRVRALARHMSARAWAGVDVAVAALGTLLAYTAVVFGDAGYAWVLSPGWFGAAYCASIALAGIVFGLYERDVLLVRSRIVLRSVLAIGLATLLTYACIFTLFHADASRWLGVLVATFHLAVAVPLRLAAHELITGGRARLLCIGTGDSVRKVAALLATRQHPHYELVGHVRVAPPRAAGFDRPFAERVAGTLAQARDAWFERRCPCLGGLDDVPDVLRDHAVDEVVVGMEVAADPGVGPAVAACLETPLRVIDQPTFIEKLLGEAPVDAITAAWFLSADVQTRASYEAVKRFVDISVAGLGLLLTLPFWPLIALVIRLDSRGPALYRQRRVGLHGRPFEIVKFRTMRRDAEADGVRWAASNDPRITRVGRWLRRSRLDELPQLWNILNGEMSLVGPRPERPEFVERLADILPHYRHRHLVKPGLTGWAQIRYRYGASVSDAHRKLCFDLYYLKHRSLELDLGILIRTAGTFVMGAR